MEFINPESLRSFETSFFRDNVPFPHIVLEDFFRQDVAKGLSEGFPDYGAPLWHVYKNAIEDKKTLNGWNEFNSLQYKVFSEFNSPGFVHFLERAIGGELFPDHGLHGGGLHIHGDGGNLNPHLDYSIHPKIGLQRKINIIVYLEMDYREEWGGHFGLWQGGGGARPGRLVKEVFPLFNRAVILDTTKRSWHGLSRKLKLPEGKFRKSFAVYYLQRPQKNVDKRTRALFAPREDQLVDKDIARLIRMRAKEGAHADVYVSDLGVKR